MSGANSFGSRFVVTSFGESHGVALGAVIDGVPAGLPWDDEILRSELARRRPGTSSVVSARQEQDRAEVLSGVYQGKTLGTPIAVIVRNHDQRPEDYAEIARAAPRPGHADDVWKTKFAHADPRGGGRSSGRETVARVMGGAVARMLLRELSPGLRVTAFSRAIGPFSLSEDEVKMFMQAPSDDFVARFPSASRSSAVEKLLSDAKSEGRSYGGIAEIRVSGAPAGLGQPVFHKLKADLASALIGVGAANSVEFGEGFAAATAEGSEFHRRKNADHYGGIRGGISSGETITVRVGFKPTATVLDEARKGRHDPCIVPRAIPVLEAMTFLVLADHFLWMRTDRIDAFSGGL